MIPPLESMDFSEVCSLPSTCSEIFFFVSVLLISSLIPLCSHNILCMTSNFYIPWYLFLVRDMVCFCECSWALEKKKMCVLLFWGQGLYMCQLDAVGRLCCSYSIHADFLSRRWEVGVKVPNHIVDLFIPPSALPVCASCTLRLCCFLCSHLEL